MNSTGAPCPECGWRFNEHSPTCPTRRAAPQPDPYYPTNPIYAEIVDDYEAQQKRP